MSTTNTQKTNSTSTTQGTAQTQNNANALWDLGYKNATSGPPAYNNPLTAGLTPDQMAAFDLIRNSGTVGQGALDQGVAFATQAGQYQPQQVTPGQAQAFTSQGSGPIDPSQFTSGAGAYGGPMASAGVAGARDVNTKNLTDVDLQGYMNPYTNDVVNSAVKSIQQNQGQANATLSGQQAASGAFGDSRSGVQAALQNQLFDQNTQSTVSNLYQQGFLNAQGQAQTDLSRQLQAQGMNQNADVATSVANAGNQTQASIANGNLGLSAWTTGQNNSLAAQMQNASLGQQNNQFNAGQQQQNSQFNVGTGLQAGMANQNAGLSANQQALAAAGTLGNLGMAQQQRYLNQANAQGAAGAVAQQTNQAGLTAQYQKFLNEQGWSQQQIANLMGIFGQTAPATGMTQTGQQTSQQKSSLVPQVLGAGLSLASGGLPNFLGGNKAPGGLPAGTQTGDFGMMPVSYGTA